jgi:hypothetical protein
MKTTELSWPHILTRQPHSLEENLYLEASSTGDTMEGRFFCMKKTTHRIKNKETHSHVIKQKDYMWNSSQKMNTNQT